MPLLNIVVSKRQDYVCSLEESTAKQVDRYAHFLKVPADEVVIHALEYVFKYDKEFVRFLEETKNAEVPESLRRANEASEDAPEGKSRRRNVSSAAR